MTNAFRFQIILPLLAMLLIAALASVVHADTIPLTVDNCSFTASSKTYDATTDASINVAGCNSPTLNAAGIVPGDDVSVILGSISGSFDTKDVGNGKTVTLSGLTLIGADAANYSILEPTATANITPATLNGSFHAGDKVYDGTAAASITGEFINPLGTDDVSLSGGTATFADKNAGTNKDVTLLNAGLVGADVGNYTLGTISGTQATITPKPLTVTASGVDKVFDGTTNATVTLATDAYGSDDVTAGYTSASLADENVANGIAVAVSGISIGGTDAVNYTLQNTTDSTSADITAATSSVNFTCTTESYDSTPKETCSATVIGAGGLSQNISGDIQYTTNTNAGTAGASVSYAGDLNHSATATSTTFTITPIALVVTANDS